MIGKPWNTLRVKAITIRFIDKNLAIIKALPTNAFYYNQIQIETNSDPLIVATGYCDSWYCRFNWSEKHPKHDSYNYHIRWSRISKLYPCEPGVYIDKFLLYCDNDCIEKITVNPIVNETVEWKFENYIYVDKHYGSRD